LKKTSASFDIIAAATLRCNHSVCEDCKIWNTETVALMTADYEKATEDEAHEKEAQEEEEEEKSSHSEEVS